jgi:hypothetical protein
MKPIQLKYTSPTEVKATPTQMTVTMYTSTLEDFSIPAKKENINTATGVKAFNIYILYRKKNSYDNWVGTNYSWIKQLTWIYDTDRYMYALLDSTRLTAKKHATGNICFCMTSTSTLFSLTPGNMLVALDIIWVNTVARNMCQVVRNMGKGKSIWSKTALLNRI